MEDNYRYYADATECYQDYALLKPERTVLEKLKQEWCRMRMLDIGVGTGRTTYTFAALTKEYVGIDYSANMIQQCKKVIEESETVQLKICDARELSGNFDQVFDFILFSGNGIDSVGHEDRLKILHEVREVVSDEGYFFFTSHSLYGFPFKPAAPRMDFGRLLPSVYLRWKHHEHVSRMRRIYRNIDSEEVLGRDWAVLIDYVHRREHPMEIYHIKPSHQVEQLREVGFHVECALDSLGKEIDALTAKSEEYVSYLCKPMRKPSQ